MKYLGIALGLSFLATSGWAQDQGHVGVFADSLGTIQCTSVPPWTMKTLYVIATTSGASGGGFTGVELRIEVQNPSGYMFNYIPPDSAQIYGDPLSAVGSNIVWPSCQTPGGGGKVSVGKIQVINTGSGTPTDIFVRHRQPPSNEEHPCPLFVLCDAPAYSIQCATTPVDSVYCINR